MCVFLYKKFINKNINVSMGVSLRFYDIKDFTCITVPVNTLS